MSLNGEGRARPGSVHWVQGPCPDKSIHNGRTVSVLRYRAGLHACRCMPGSWVVSTGGTWGRDSVGGVGLQGAGSRCRCRVYSEVRGHRREGQVLQGAAGAGQGAEECGRCRGREAREGRTMCRDYLARVPACDNVPSALVDHTFVWLSKEHGSGTRVQGRHMGAQ